MKRLNPKPLTQREADALPVGSWMAVLWKRFNRQRAGPFPYRVCGKFNGRSVIAEDCLLVDVDLRSREDHNMAWLLEVPRGSTVTDSFQLAGSGGDPAGGGRDDGGPRSGGPPHDS